MSVALVTGTSSGMGLYAAVELAATGHTVVATMRDRSRSQQLEAEARRRGESVDLRVLDVTDPEARERCVREVMADHGSIDILVNNAGQGIVATAEQLSLEEIQAQLEVNYLAPVALTKLVLPQMRERGSGRIMTVTSVGGAVGQPFADAYCGAKFAVEGFMQSLAVLLERFGVWVSVIEPGAVASDFVQNVTVHDEPGPYTDLLVAYRARTTEAFSHAQSPADAGAAIAAAVTSDTYQFRWQTSDSAARFVSLSVHDLDGSNVAELTRTWVIPASE